MTQRAHARGARPRLGAALRAARLAALLLALGCGGASEPSRPPNVVFVVLDTLRPDHLGVYGYEKETAPFLARLASESAVLRNAVSTSSWTAPATASIFTGLYPTRHGVIEGFFAHKQRMRAIYQETGKKVSMNRIPEPLETLPEIFSDAGYATYGVATNVNIGSAIGFDRGFDRFRRLPARQLERADPSRMIPARHRVSATAGRVLATLEAWRAEIEAKEPALVYLHLNDPHRAYRKHAPWYRDHPDRVERLKSAYDSEIRYLDRRLRDLHRWLDAGRDTMWVVVSDHGEAFGEHGIFAHPPFLWEELTRVLMLVCAPGSGVASQQVAERVSLVDVLPTVHELAGLGGLEKTDGLSLAPLLREAEGAKALERRLEARSVLAHRAKLVPPEEHTWAVYRGDWKLLRQRDGEISLFDLQRDPDEQEDRAEARPELRRTLRAELRRFRSEARDASATHEVEIDRETLEALEALGYTEGEVSP